MVWVLTYDRVLLALERIEEDATPSKHSSYRVAWTIPFMDVPISISMMDLTKDGIPEMIVATTTGIQVFGLHRSLLKEQLRSFLIKWTQDQKEPSIMHG